MEKEGGGKNERMPTLEEMNADEIEDETMSEDGDRFGSEPVVDITMGEDKFGVKHQQKD